jgi:hypothetical protein
MLKRINYTDRRRIPRNQVAVKVDPTDPASFTIDLPADLLSNPDMETAYVDITSAGNSEVLRHRLTWTGSCLARGPYPLGRISWKKAIFDIKVVETAGEDPGRILRRASRLKAVGAGGEAQDEATHQLLTTIREPLGEQVWTLRFTDEVTLVINDALTMSEEQFVAHQAFASLVFPEICRRAVEWALVSEGVLPGDLNAEETSSAALWVRFAIDMAPDAECPLTPTGGWTPHNRSELDEWIDEVVRALCRRHRLSSALTSGSLEVFS